MLLLMINDFFYEKKTLNMQAGVLLYQLTNVI